MELPYDKIKEQRRAFGFIEFKKLAGLKKCLEKTSHKIGTHEVMLGPVLVVSLLDIVLLILM